MRPGAHARWSWNPAAPWGAYALRRRGPARTLRGMGKKAEQVSGARHCSEGMRRSAKREATRARRRAERRDPENAPRRLRDVTRGWAD